MKKINTLLYSIVLVFLTTKTQAQIQLSSDDVYSKGTFHMTLDTSHGFDIGTPGMSKTWNFGTLKSHVPYEIQVAPFYDALIDANLVEIEDGDTNVRLKKTSTTIHMLLQIDDMGNYQKLRIFNFPLNYNAINRDSIKSTSYYTGDDFGIPLVDSVRVKISVNYYSKADAWGNIKLPLGNFDALRINAIFTSAFTVEGKKGSFAYKPIPGFEQKETSNYFTWYSKNKGYYLANYDADYDEMAYMTSGVLSVKNDGPVKNTDILVTNPIRNEFTLKNNNNYAYLVALTDVNGKQFFSYKIDGFSTKVIDASELPAGFYNLQLYNLENHTISYQKLIK